MKIRVYIDCELLSIESQREQKLLCELAHLKALQSQGFTKYLEVNDLGKIFVQNAKGNGYITGLTKDGYKDDDWFLCAEYTVEGSPDKAIDIDATRYVLAAG